MKKALSILIALVMILSLCVPAFAAEKKLNYVVLGDSIARGAGIVNSDDACYGRIVANTNGYNYANFGVDGATSSFLLTELGYANVSKAVENADIISISIGGNNFLTQNMFWIFVTLLFNNKSEVNRIIDGFYSDFCRIIETIKKKNPDAVILMQTLYNPWKIAGIANIYQKAINELNGCYTRYLKEHPGAYVIVDVASAFAAESGRLIAADTIHPNARGNKLIATVILKKLKELGLGTKTEPVIVTEPLDAVSFRPKNYIDMVSYYLNIFSGR